MSAFAGTKWLEKQPEGPVYVNDILLTWKGQTETAIIDEGTTYIEEAAFDNQKQLKNVLTSSSVTTIRSCAFNNCYNLNRIVIPETVTSIEKYAVGYHSEYGEKEKDLNLVIAGTKGSEAERYAIENGFTFEGIIPITGIKISQAELSLEKGESKSLSVTVEPENTTEDKTVTWSSDNEGVAKVDENGNVVAVGKGTALITARVGAFTETCKVTVHMSVVHLSEAWVTISPDTAAYSGEEIRPDVTVNTGEKNLEQGKDYTVEYKNNINADEDATVQITGIGEYTGTVSKHFTILRAEIVESMVTLKETKLVYTGETLMPEVVVKAGNHILVEGQDYKLVYSNNVQVGSDAQIDIIGLGNYCSIVTKKFEIVDAIRITDSMVTLENGEYSYTGKAIKPAITVKDGENSLAEGKDYKISYSNNVNAGTAAVKVEGIGAYAGTVEKNFTIMPTVSYRTQVQDYGWEKTYAENGSLSGTVGKNKRLETIQIKVGGDTNLGIKYRTHVEEYGWQSWTEDDSLSGTVGKAKRLEAIQIQLTGTDSEKYDVYYRVHAEDYGWLNWTANGGYAGTSGLAKKLEAIQIVVVKKDAGAPGNVEGIASINKQAYIHKTHTWNNGEIVKAPTCTEKGQKELTCTECGSKTKQEIAATGHTWDEGTVTKEATSHYVEDGEKTYTCKECGIKKTEAFSKAYPVNITYTTQVGDYGWQKPAKNGEIGGTIGNAKQLETMNITVANLNDSDSDLSVKYNAHVVDIGWQGKTDDISTWKSAGENAGTVGRAKQLEAIQVQLTGTDAEKYDVYYRVHAADYGWLSWAKNGAIAGTAGYGKRLEAVQIVVVERNSEAPDVLGGITSINRQAYVHKTHTWDAGTVTKEAASYTEDGEKTYTCKDCGTKKTEAFSKAYPVDITYTMQVEDYGWLNPVKNGAIGGTVGKAKRMETMSISVQNLTDKDSDLGISYHAHVEDIGWQGKTDDVSTWKTEGENAGTVGRAKRLEALQIQLTGTDAEKYDVYYRVHAEDYGWLNWAKNGEISGTAGYGKRLEALQIIVVEKGAKINTSLGGIKSVVKQSYIIK